MTLRERITTSPHHCGGQPCVRHLRMRVSDVLGLLAAGESSESILAHHPDLEADDIAACQEFQKRSDRIDAYLTAALVLVTMAYGVATIILIRLTLS